MFELLLYDSDDVVLVLIDCVYGLYQSFGVSRPKILKIIEKLRT